MRSVLAPSLLTLAAIAAASPSFAATTYTIKVISPSTGIYLNSQGGTYVTSVKANAAGDVAGVSFINPSLGTGLLSSSGQAVWYYNPITGATTAIDLASNGVASSVAGTSYLQSSGYGNASLVALTSTGYAVGTSSIYNNGNLQGSDAWIYTPATTSAGIGTTSRVPALNVNGATLPFSVSHSMNVTTVTNAGVVVGSIPLWSGFSQAGNAAYVYTAGTSASTAITINSAANASSDGVVAYTDPSGFLHTFVNATSSSAGMVAGTVSGYDNNFFGQSLGQDAWVLNTAGGNSFATIISPGAGVSSFGATFTSDNTNEGQRLATVAGMNASGSVIGYSTRYVSGTASGSDAWVYNGSSTQIIGLHDSSYVTSAGITNTAFAISGNGIVAGYVVPGNTSFQASNVLRDAWVYKPSTNPNTLGTTIRVGLTGSAYTSSTTQLRSTAISAVGAGGQVAGTALRYDPTTGVNFQNQDAWYVNANTATSISDTKMIGLNSATGFSASIYENSGVRFSTVSSINAIGEAAGYSTRYGGGTSVGQDAFVYDPTTSTNYALNFSTSSTSAAFSVINYLSDTGLALGTYTVYSGSTALGTDLFAWQEVNGNVTWADLGSEITNLSAGQWASLASVLSMDANGDIVGLGQLAGYTGTTLGTNTSTSVFLLTPTAAVPEPASIGMLALGGVALIRRSRRAR